MTATSPSRPRRQQDRSGISRQKILRAAVQALVEHGYSGASTLRIQQIAEVSRGRLLHHFPSRDALLVEAVSHVATQRIDDMSTPESTGTDPAERIDRAVEAMWSTYRTDYFWAATELWLGARNNDELRRALVDVERSTYRRVQAATDRFFGPDLAGHPEYARIRDLVNTSMRGVALTYAFERRPHRSDPHLPLWQDLVRRALLA